MRRILGRAGRGREESSGPSIHAHIAAHLRPDGPGLLPGGERLPDDERDAAGLLWAPGALDGVLTHHAGGGGAEAADIGDLVDLIRAAAPGGDDEVASLERALASVSFVGLVDPLLDGVRAAGTPPDRILSLGRRLATTSRSRNAVKLGIALIGLIAGTADRDTLLTLGRHDEFTLFSAVALLATEPDPEGALWVLARLVDGWGRIHLVERFRHTSRPEIRDWILREGYRNTVSDGYLAAIAADAGGLADALARPEPDEELIGAARHLVGTLLEPFGPGGGLDDYADAPRALELLLGHLGRRPPSLAELGTVDAIAAFLDDDAGWESRAAMWPAGARDRLRAACASIRARPEWPALIMAGLMSDDAAAFGDARRAATALGLDTLDAQLRFAAAHPTEADWFTLLREVDESRIDRAVDLAMRGLSLEALATGPALDLGLGPEFRSAMTLGLIAQELRRFPGRGWPALRVALRNPVIRNRNMALQALSTWPRATWPAEAVPLLRAAAREEPDADVRARIEGLLDAATHEEHA